MFFFFKQKTAYEMRISDWSSDVCSSDLKRGAGTLTLSGANTYSNRTVIDAGTLALAGAGTIGAGNLVIGANAEFDISQADVGASVIQLNGPAEGSIALGGKTLTLGFGASITDWEIGRAHV